MTGCLDITAPGLFNYVIAHRGLPRLSEATEIAAEGNEAPRKIRQDCRPDLGYAWRLP